MPYRRKPTRRPRRRRKKGTVRRSNRRTVALYKSLRPDTQILRMRYHTTISLDPTTGLVDNHLFRADSIFDPDSTGIGHSAMGYNEFSALWRHYCVLGAKITARFVSQGDLGNTNTGIAGIGLQRSNTLVSSLDTVIERGKARTKILTQGNANQTCTLVQYYSARKFHGWKDIGDSNETRTTFGANPPDQAYFNVFLGPMKSSDNVAVTPVSVTIDYIVKLMEKIDLLES